MISGYLAIAGERIGQGLSRELFAKALLRRFGEIPKVIREPGKKPEFADKGLGGFSVSHTGGLYLILFSPDPVGVDMEIPRQIRAKMIADRFFCPGEKEILEHSGYDRRCFFDIWTKKEALTKLSGVGLSGLSGADGTKAATTDLSGAVSALCGREVSAHAAPAGDVLIEIL